MYPRSRAKGGLQGAGQGDGDTVPGAASSMPTSLASNALSSSFTTVGHGEPVHTLSSSTASHHTSTGSGNRQSMHASQLQQSSSSSPMAHMQSGMYCEGMQDVGASSSASQLPQFYAGNALHSGGSLNGSMHRTTTSSSYDQQKQSMSPSPPLHMNSYQGDWVAAANCIPTMCGTAKLGSPAGVPTSGAAAQVSFSPHSRTNSSTLVTPIMGIAAASSSNSSTAPPVNVAAPPSTDYRPPPVYVEKTLGSSIGPGASVTNSSSPPSLNRGSAPFSGSLVNTVNAARRSSCVASSMAGTSTGISTAIGATAPPPLSNTSTGAPIVQSGLTGLSSPVEATPARSSVPGVTSLKVTVGGCSSVVTASAPLTPLKNSPLLAQQQQQHWQTRRPPSAERSSHPLNTALEPRKCGGASDKGETLVPVGGVEGTDVEFDEDRSRSPGIGPVKPTVAQAEARYQYLYDEFRKVSRLRGKLAEENERMKREQTTLREAVDLCRRQIVSAAEEREALLADYREDMQDMLRLAQELATNVVAAHNKDDDGSLPALASKGGEHGTHVESPHQALDAAISRISASTASIAVATPLTPPSSSAPVWLTPPRIPESFSGLSLLSIGEKFGLRCGKWLGPQAPEPRLPTIEEDCNCRDPTEQRGIDPGRRNQRCDLLRDEVSDVYCNTHAAISAYMASLDYGLAPSSSQGPYLPVGRQGRQRPQQKPFSSEYRGLHLHVDIPHFPAQKVSCVSDLANTGGDYTHGQDTPLHSRCSQLPPAPQPPSPRHAPEYPCMTSALT